MRAWEYIWLSVVEPVDESINKKEFLKKKDAEKIIKESIKARFGYHLCCSDLPQKMPEEVYNWWLNHYTPCMINHDCPNKHDRCWNEFLNKVVGGFVPEIIRGGKR